MVFCYGSPNKLTQYVHLFWLGVLLHKTFIKVLNIREFEVNALSDRKLYYSCVATINMYLPKLCASEPSEATVPKN